MCHRKCDIQKCINQDGRKSGGREGEGVGGGNQIMKERDSERWRDPKVTREKGQSLNARW